MNDKLLNEYLNVPKKKNKIANYFTKILVSLILFFSGVIFCNYNDNNARLFKKYVFDDTFNFMSFQKFYKSLTSFTKETDAMAMTSNLDYLNGQEYLLGSKFTVGKDSNVNLITSGIVIYVGSKDGYNNTIIIQSADGYDFWYGNLSNISISLYDYVKSGSVIATCDDELFLVIQKDEKYYTYEEYIAQVS